MKFHLGKILLCALILSNVRAQKENHIVIKNEYKKAISWLPFSWYRLKKRFYLGNSFVGKIPKKVAFIINQLNSDNYKKFLNRAIFYGPPGNGKSTLAKKIAELTDSEFIIVAAPTIVGKYVGQGVKFITNIFEDIEKKLTLSNKKIVIFFDEIDAIATHNSSELKTPHTESLQALWLKLDEFKNNKNVFIICATNDIEKLHNTFLDRFGNNLIEIKNPALEKRKQILEHYFEDNDLDVDQNIIKKLAQKCSGYSIRTLENLVTEIAQQYVMEPDEKLDNIIWSEYSYMNRKYGKILRDKKWKEFLDKFSNYTSTFVHLSSFCLVLYKAIELASDGYRTALKKR